MGIVHVLASLLCAALLVGLYFFIARLSLATARRLWLVIFTLVVGAGVTMMATHAFVAKWGFRGDSEKDGLIHLMDATAHRPFVFRRLSPAIVAAVSNAAYSRLPARAAEYLTNDSPLKRYRANWAGEESWTTKKALAFHVAYSLFWTTMFGALLSMTGLLCALRGSPWFNSFVAATLGICLLPLMFVNGGYLYDAPELFLWITVLLIAVRGPLLLLPPTFLLLLINKESALMTVPALMPFLVQRVGMSKALKWGAGLGVIGVLWVWHVRTRFANSPGPAMEMYLWGNLEFWGSPTTYLKVGTPYAPWLPAPRGGNVLLLLLAFIPFRFGWRALRSDARLATLIQALVFVPLFLVAGSKDEMRGLSLLFPLLFVLGVEGVHVLVAKSASTQS